MEDKEHDFRLSGDWCIKPKYSWTRVDSNMIGFLYDHDHMRFGPDIDSKQKEIQDLKKTKHEIENALKTQSRIKDSYPILSKVYRNSIANSNKKENIQTLEEVDKIIMEELTDSVDINETEIDDKDYVDVNKTEKESFTKIDVIIKQQSDKPENGVIAGNDLVDNIVGADFVKDSSTVEQDNIEQDNIEQDNIKEENKENTEWSKVDKSQEIIKVTNVEITSNESKEVDSLRKSVTELKIAVDIKDQEIENLQNQNSNLLKQIERVSSTTTITNTQSTNDTIDDEDDDNTDDDDDDDTDETERDVLSDSDDSDEVDNQDDDEEDDDDDDNNAEAGLFDFVASYFSIGNDNDDENENGLITEEKLQQVFKQVDVDGSDLIDFNEFKNCIELLKLGSDDDINYDKEFKRVDKDKTGYLDYGEFRCAILGKNVKTLSVNRLKLMFDELDVDNTQTLDLTEFITACDKLQFAQLTDENDQDIEQYFNKVDSDNSGVVDFPEFVQAILGKELTGKEEQNADKYSNKIRAIKTVFNKMDANNSGKLELDEFILSAKKLNCKQTDQELEKLFHKNDTNNDETIGMAEFVSLMYKLSTRSIETKTDDQDQDQDEDDEQRPSVLASLLFG